MQLQYLRTSTVALLLLSFIITISLCYFFIFSTRFFFHTFVNIQAIAKDQRDLICGQLLIFV